MMHFVVNHMFPGLSVKATVEFMRKNWREKVGEEVEQGES